MNYIFAAIIVFSVYSTVARANGDEIAQAKLILSAKDHLKSPLEKLSPLGKIDLKFYTSQLNAIKILGSNADLKAVGGLIIYLDYPVSAMDVLTKFPHMNELPEEALQNTRSTWPAFAAILDIPHSQDILSIYALDKIIPWNID